MSSLIKLTSAALLILGLVFLAPVDSSASAKAQKRKGHPPVNSLSRAESKEAEARLAEMGYGTGRVDGVIDETLSSLFRNGKAAKLPPT